MALALLFSLATVALPQAVTPDAALAAARAGCAERYLDGPRAGLELAKAERDAGRLELAVLVSEETRHRFGDDAFDALFYEVMQITPDPEPDGAVAAELVKLEALEDAKDAAGVKAAATAALAKHPRSSEIHFLLAKALQQLKEDATAAWDKVAELAPHSPNMIGWAARYRWKSKEDRDGALDLYQRTYLCDPHFYDTEFAESRITNEIGPKRSAALYQEAIAAGDFRKALALDRYWGPDRALQKLRKEWKPEYVDDAIAMLAHDTSTLRWNATELLVAHAADVPDAKLDALLKNDDARLRGLALYVALKKRGEKAFPDAKRALAQGCQLERFDAISALVMHGGEKGKQLARDHAKDEKHPKIREMLAHVDDKK